MSAGRPVELAAADKVDVQVKDRLSGAGADVKNGAVSVLDAALAGDFGGCEMTASYHFGVSASCFFQSGKVFFWNHQHVGGRLRIQVFEGVRGVVFVNFPGRNFLGNDAAEQAVGHVILERDKLSFKHNISAKDVDLGGSEDCGRKRFPLRGSIVEVTGGGLRKDGR
jgi:hypothetical protein